MNEFDQEYEDYLQELEYLRAEELDRERAAMEEILSAEMSALGVVKGNPDGFSQD
jgi:hypothetical protein